MSLIDDPKMREVFEKMTGRFRIPAEQLQKDADGEYIDKETFSYWTVFGIAWAESRAALVIELPSPEIDIDPDEEDYEIAEQQEALSMCEHHAIARCKKAIEATGVRVQS